MRLLLLMFFALLSLLPATADARRRRDADDEETVSDSREDDEQDAVKPAKRAKASHSLRARVALARRVLRAVSRCLPHSDRLHEMAATIARTEETRYRAMQAKLRRAYSDERKDIEKESEVSTPLRNVLDGEPTYDSLKDDLQKAEEDVLDAQADYLEAKDKFKAGDPKREKIFKAYEDAQKTVEAARKAEKRGQKVENARDYFEDSERD